MQKKIMLIKDFEWVEVEVGETGISPCPFCGGEPMLMPLTYSSESMWFGCANPDCIASRLMVLTNKRHAEEAINKWNIRI